MTVGRQLKGDEYMKKRTLFTKLTLLCVGFLFFASCSDLLNSHDESSSARGGETGSVVFNGTISVSGALPAALSHATESSHADESRHADESCHAELDSASLAQEIPRQARNDNTSARNDSVASRSALPSFTTDHYYYVAATQANGSGSVNINSLSNSTSFTTTNGVTFALKLTNGSWNIEAGIKKAKSSGTAGADDVSVMSETYPVTISAADPVVSHTFYPKPSQEGSGLVGLSMTIPATVTTVTAVCSNSNWRDNISVNVAPTSVTVMTSGGSTPSGSYEVAFNFYDENNILLYSTVQTINVFDNMTTNSWVSDGSTLINASGVFNLTSTLINQFKRTTFYVGQTPAATSLDITADDTSGTGSAYSPLKSVTKAASIIAAAGESSKDYRIYVCGEVTGAQEISEAINGRAKSLTIEGLNGLDENSKPKDELNGAFSWDSQGTVLTISSCTVPVIIKNLKITGGCNSASGGGISIGGKSSDAAGKANLTLDSGTLITENYIRPLISGGNVIKTHGAGIYMYYGKLTMKNGAVITKNKTLQNASVNMVYSSGAGIGLNTGTEFIMEGGEITENIAYGSGGAICMETNNFSSDISVTLSGGLISGNQCQQGNGGSIADLYGNSLTIGGSVHIPYGGAEKSNDIYLASGKTVTLTSPLTAHSASDQIAITPSEWTPGKTVVQADGTKVTDLTPYKDYFAFTQDGWECKVSSDPKFLLIDATIYVAESGNNETGKGTKSKPFATIEKASELVKSGDVDYTIYIVGTVKGNQVLPSSISAKSLTIEGKNDLIDNSEPKAVLDGNKSGTTLTIKSNAEIPVTIKNLKITGGSGTNVTENSVTQNRGGGIYISDSSVALGDGVLVTKNEAEYGGGIYNTNGKLCLYGNAMVGMKTTTIAKTDSWGNKAETGAGIYSESRGQIYLGYSSWASATDNTPSKLTGGVCGNYSGNYNDLSAINVGGGIYATGLSEATIKIASGNISYNCAVNGAGIYSRVNIEMTGGTIEGNEGNTNSGGGGGVYLTSGKSITMSGDAVITKNRNMVLGAGVFLGPDGDGLLMTGGTISENEVLNQGHGGAVFTYNADSYCHLQGTASIPYGGDVGKNDIYLNNQSIKVKITGPLSEEREAGNVISLTPLIYTEGLPLLEAVAGVNLANQVGKFTATQYVSSDGSIRKDYSLDSEGKLHEGLSLPSSLGGLASGKTYSVIDSSDMQTLAGFSSLNCTFSGVTLKLGADITIDTAWTPIGNSTAFSGTFDGNEKTVTFASGAAAEAFFGTVNGTVKNLKVAGSTSVAGIAKKANGASALIENCENSATVTGNITQEYVAGIVAEVSGATIKGCVNKGTVISNYETDSNVGINKKGAGGITGPIQNGGVVDSCTNTGRVTGLGAGGISSHISYTCTIRNSQNSGDITSTRLYAGGIAGVASGNGSDLSQASHIDNCFNSGSVTASGTGVSVYAGGIVGALGWGSTAWAQNCLNIGNVSLSSSAASGSKAGALFGSKDNNAKIDFCYYKEGCAGTSFGNGGSTSDTANQCIKAAQSGSGNAAISAGVTLNETTYSAGISTVLSLLNAWVTANNTDGLYLVWESDTNHWPKLKLPGQAGQ